MTMTTLKGLLLGFAGLLLTAPASAQSAFVAPSLPAEPCARWAYELTATNKLCPPNPLTGKRPTAEDRAWQDQQAGRYCRMEKDIRLVNGSVLAQQGQVLEVGTLNVSWGPSNPDILLRGSFVDRIQSCTPEQRQAMVDANAALILGYAPYSLGDRPMTGVGSVHVRSHTRCNYSKCWSVRSYWRRR
jgi:hypothetical protein